MSGTQAVSDKWDTNIVQNSTLRAYTESIYLYNILEETTTDSNKYYYGEEINFITIDIFRGSRLESSNCITYFYEVEVNYILVHDPDGEHQQQVKTVLETIESLVRSELGQSWDGTVDMYTNQERPIRLNQIVVDDQRCWQGTYTFRATKSE